MLNLKRFFTFICIVTASTTASGQSGDADTNPMVQMGGILMVGKSLQRMTDTCSVLFPSQEKVYSGLYEASTVPRYLKLFSFESKMPLLTGSREKQLQALGMSEQDANTWCNTEFTQELDRFDKQYGQRYDAIQRAFSELKQEIAKQKQLPTQRRQPSPPDPRVAGLMSRIAETSKLSFDSGNWALFAELYEPDTFACWQQTPSASGYGFLAMEPIPAEATYKVEKFTDYTLGNGTFTNHVPTHLMEISYEQSHDGTRCGLEERKRWPKHHFFLVQQGDSFSLTHYCPLNPSEPWPIKPKSAIQLAKNMGRLDAEDWQIVPAEVKKDTFFSRGALTHLQNKYGFNHQEASDAIDYICDPQNVAPQ